MKKPRSLCTRLGAALLTVCLLLGLLPIASAASAAPRTPVAADGRILYVAPNGSDANPGSYAEPFATLEAAMNAMNPGDLLYVRGGLYRSAGTGRGISQKKGTVDKWFTVLNYPGETPVFDGEWYGDATIGMLFDSCAYWHIEGLEFRNYTQDAVYLRNGCDHFEIVNMKLHDVTSLVHGASAYDGIVVIGSTNVLIEGCEIWNIGYARDLGSMLDHGVYVSTGSSNVTVRGCYFHEIPSGSGVQFNHEPVHDGLVENNLFVNTALGTVLSQCYNVTVKNNTYYHKDAQFGNTINGSTNGWQVLTATFTSQADATLLCVDLVTEGKGEWYYDDINLSETRTVPQAADEIFRSMLANPGFEKDFAGTWTRAHYYPSGVESSCSIERDNTVAYSGMYSMHYHVGTAAVTEVSLGTDFRTAVKPNTSYKITLQAKTSAETSAEAKIWLNLGECFATPTWGDIYNDVQKGNILTGPQADWTAISATIYTAANAEYINVQPAVSGTGDFWFDHIIVVEIPGEANALDTAKNAALDSLDAAVAALDQNAYTYWNWALVQTAKMNGINAVKQASDAASADAAAAAAVSAIQAVKPISATKTEMSAQIAAAKKTVSDAADPDDYREAQKMEVQKLQSAFAQLVDTFDTEQSIEKLTKKCCDLLAAIKTDEQITAEELAAAKAAAKDALDKYAVRSDYTLENWNLVKAEKKKGNAAIDAATSVAAVDKALAAAKAAIDQIESISGAAERLAKAKQDAIEELRAYMQSKDFPADKQSEAERILNDGIAEINAAETLDDVADALATAKEALRKLASGGEPSEEERLAEAKQNAEEALKDYADGKTFTGANTRPAVDAIIKATKAINAASTVDEVNAALAEAKAALDRLASDAPIDKPDQPIIVVPVTRPSENKTFKDVSSSDWFYDEVQYVYQKNLMNGTGTSSFSPRDTLTRAMLVTILYRIEGEPSVSYSGKFSDVPSGRWYSKAVEWAAAQGIVGGYSNGKFGPEDSVTREQLAAILYRYAGKTKGFDVSASASLSGYTDSAKVSAYAQSAVKWAIATNLLLPTSGKLNAGADATRAEVAVAVARFHQQFVK